MKKKGRSFMLIIAVIVAAQTFLCPVGVAATSTSKPVVLQLRWQHQYQFAGYYAALWNGYFKEEGFDVEIRPAFQPDGSVLNAVDEVAEGRADYGVGASDILLSRDKGQDVRLVASFFQRSAVEFYTRSDASVRVLADLAPMKLLRRQGDLLDIELRAMMAAEGITLDTEALLPANREVDAEDLISGAYDLVPGYLGTIPYYAAQKGQLLNTLRPIDYGIDFYGDSLFTSGHNAQNNPEKVERFRRAVVKGWKYALENPESLADRIARDYPQSGKTFEELRNYNLHQAEEVYKLTYYPVVEVGNINGFRWRETGRILKELGLVTGEPAGGSFIFDYQDLKQQRNARIQRALILGFGSLIAVLTVLWLIQLKAKNRQLAREVLLKTEAQVNLTRSNEQYESIFNNTVVGITVTDPNGRILQTNERWNALTGYSSGELNGRIIYELMVPEERDKARVENVARVFDEGYITERLYQRKDGTTFWGRLYINSIPESFSDGRAYLGIIVDVTAERVEAEALQRSEARFRELVRQIAGRTGVGEEIAEGERQDLALKLEEINLELEKLFKNEMDDNRLKEALLIHQARQAAMGEMVASIAHQWRQPLNSLSLVLGNLVDAWTFGELDNNAFEASIEKSKKLIKRMSETIDAFRDFLKPDQVMESFSLNRNLKDVLELMEDSIRTGGVTVTQEFKGEYTVFGYPSQLSQVLFNLLRNALDALAEVEGRQRHIHIEGAMAICGGTKRVVLTLCDTGGGIDSSVFSRVFEPYVTTKQQKEGTGLGLYISRLIVENTMKGTLSLANTDQGLCATVTLPLSDPGPDWREEGAEEGIGGERYA